LRAACSTKRRSEHAACDREAVARKIRSAENTWHEKTVQGGVVRLTGAHNGMAALQAKAAGFEALYLSRAAMTASMGLPDLGIITVDEVALRRDPQ
jgi:2-methylisocitrate lyase-like PEP mutase family enzyme